MKCIDCLINDRYPKKLRCASCRSKQRRSINSAKFNFQELEGEIWVDIIGYEGLYMVSNKGRIKSLEVSKTTKNGQVRKNQLKLLKNRLDGQGYHYVSLYKNKVSLNHKVHRLVAINFVPNPQNKPQVNHKNFIKTDNTLDNLEWATNSENTIHSYLFSNRKTILSVQDHLEIKKSNKKKTELAKIYNTTTTTIYRIQNNQIRKYL